MKIYFIEIYYIWCKFVITFSILYMQYKILLRICFTELTIYTHYAL